MGLSYSAPEPSTLVLLGAGLAGLGLPRRRTTSS
ncbi:MAG: PEP-CTERM sorting domain-containing protein [Terriglobia bacterium]